MGAHSHSLALDQLASFVYGCYLDTKTAAAVAALSVRNANRVRVKDFDLFNRNPEFFRCDLRERSYLTLAVGLAAGNNRDVAGLMHADDCRRPGAADQTLLSHAR